MFVGATDFSCESDSCREDETRTLSPSERARALFPSMAARAGINETIAKSGWREYSFASHMRRDDVLLVDAQKLNAPARVVTIHRSLSLSYSFSSVLVSTIPHEFPCNIISSRRRPRSCALSCGSSFYASAGLMVASVTHLALPWTIHACQFYTVPCYAFDYRQCAQHAEMPGLGGCRVTRRGNVGLKKAKKESKHEMG